MGDRWLIFALCTALVLAMAGVFAFPALLPTFVAEWGLSKTQAGWIAGLYFVGYAAVAPLVNALTDRIDARPVLLAGALLTALSPPASRCWRAASGRRWRSGCWPAPASLPPTCRASARLVHRYQGEQPSRAVSLYTSSFSLGTALSFIAGEAAAAFGWRAAFSFAPWPGWRPPPYRWRCRGGHTGAGGCAHRAARLPPRLRQPPGAGLRPRLRRALLGAVRDALVAGGVSLSSA